MILVLITHDRGQIEESTLQGLTLARTLDNDIQTVSIGVEIDGLAEYGVSKQHVIIHEGLDDYAPAAWGEALAQLIDRLRPEAVITTGTERGNEVMAHVGAITGQPMVANCNTIEAGDDDWSITRTRWGGSLLEEATLEAPVKLVTVTEHSVEASLASEPGDAAVYEFTPQLSDGDLITKVVDREVTAEGVTLATARVVVSGGRGVGSAEAFAPLEELADLLGGVVGCSRVATNNGWRPHSDQVGQTGTVVAPDLYIACGISGAIQHWVGMMASKTVLAINTDGEAPMVTKADYAVIGDLSSVVPAVVEEIRRRYG
ncbi:MAG: electron transfer flavoprotein subunit alpha/FixB family protein [Acidimicrobiia bacterium]